MKTFFKTIFRMFKQNLGRFIAITSIILVSLMLCGGLGALPTTCKNSFSKTLKTSEISDVLIKSTSLFGFHDLKDEIDSFDNVKNSSAYFTTDLNIENKYYRLYITDLNKNDVNSFKLIEGNMPQNKNEILIEYPSRNLAQYKLGDHLSFKLLNVKFNTTITGFIKSPLYLSNALEPSILDQNQKIICFIYMDRSSLPLILRQLLPYNEIAIKFNQNNYKYFTNEYNSFVKENLNYIKNNIIDNNLVYLTLNENVGYALFDNYIKKVDIIALVFPIFFILVSSLVVLTTMTRLIEDERSIIGCYSTLGIKKGRILLKYILFSLLSSFIGAFIGILVGVYLLPYIVYPAFESVFFMPKIVFGHNYYLGIICALLIAFSSLFITLYIINKNLKEEPSELLKYKTPKAGKKILLERIGLIWNHLKFKYKSSFRNIFRQKKHFLLTSLSVCGSTVLVLIGFGLFDVSTKMVGDPLFGDLIGSMKLISGIILLFAFLLCILILYNLANMNISERNRELATLKVLGYHNIECSFYTFREIMFMSIIGILLGLPIGYILIKYLLIWLDFGNVYMVNWYSYLLSFLLVIIITLIVNFILYHKVIKINMNDSLKTLE